MTAIPAHAVVPLLLLADSEHLKERPAHLPPLEEPGFLDFVRQAHPQLEYAKQRKRARGEVVHVFRDRVSQEFTVLYRRDHDSDGVKESGYPWLDRLNELGGMWRAARPQEPWGGAR
ncbi:hypothetical protein [Saccharopolyspora phatthalungensis]|uniref:Uncharacterized protein n=1 Tax=Saccharopolyspora phatthalungensis TaxID=664693 RepID=A0A840QJ62_9PSEU|nr:hypothetical protein [Saccharopolyspora phatthalungensis]MBB5159078.1 hypothetical protein [Saccharopolyspora phatthalungensis]